MKLIACIACRNNSRRLYGKPLQLLENFTVLEYIVNNLQKRNEISDIVLAISEAKGNEVFVDFANTKGLKYVIGDDRDVLDRLIKACELANGDTVYRVTSESPFGYNEGLPEAVESHIKNDADYTTHEQLPDGVLFELISLRALKQSHEEGEYKHRSELVTSYINENPHKFNLNILQVEETLRRADYRLTIDFPEDLILCRKIVRYFNGDDKAIPYKDLIHYLDTHPEVRAITENIIDENYIKPYH